MARTLLRCPRARRNPRCAALLCRDPRAVLRAERITGARAGRRAGRRALPQEALQCLEKGARAVVCLQGAAPERIMTFEHALIERPLAGDKNETTKDQGWSWNELEKIDPKAG